MYDLSGVKGHTWNYCAEEGEPGDEAIHVHVCTCTNVGLMMAFSVVYTCSKCKPVCSMPLLRSARESKLPYLARDA